MKNLESGDNNF